MSASKNGQDESPEQEIQPITSPASTTPETSGNDLVQANTQVPESAQTPVVGNEQAIEAHVSYMLPHY